MKIITRYILKEFIPTILVAFFFFFIIFIINHILIFIKPLFEKDVPIKLIAKLLVTALPTYIMFCLPFSVMLACLMSMGRFSTDNEIVAFRALGFSMIQIFRPVFICGILISILAFWINDYVLPFSIIEQKQTAKDIMRLKPTLDFKSKTIKNYFGKIIITDIVHDTSIEGLIIIDKDEKKQKRIIATREAIIDTPKDRGNTIEIKMEDAMILLDNSDRPNEFNYGFSKGISYFISFDVEPSELNVESGNEKRTKELYENVKKAEIGIKNEKKNLSKDNTDISIRLNSTIFDTEQFLKRNISENNFINRLTSFESDLKTLFENKNKKIDQRTFLYYLVEFYKKFALPIACLIFSIFATPIGIFSKRAGRSIGFIVGLFLCAMYWFMYYAGQIFGYKGMLPPFWAIFTPNIMFFVVGVYFLIRRIRE